MITPQSTQGISFRSSARVLRKDRDPQPDTLSAAASDGADTRP